MSLQWIADNSAFVITLLGIAGSAAAWSWKQNREAIDAAWEREKYHREQDREEYQYLHQLRGDEIRRLDDKVRELRAELDRLRQFLVQQERVIRYYEYHTGWPRPVFTEDRRSRH